MTSGRILVLADVHSNAPALRAVLDDIAGVSVRETFFLGDLFGYYPDAVEVWECLALLPRPVTAVLGNHDDLVLSDEIPPETDDTIAFAAAHNDHALGDDAIEWLAALPATVVAGAVHAVHGTLSMPLDGRLYPDGELSPEDAPDAGSVLLMAHTHYPIVRRERDVLVVNPGSVGQPRDGDTRASYALLGADGTDAEIRRVGYDVGAYQKKLTAMGWPARSVAVLAKDRPGPFD